MAESLPTCSSCGETYPEPVDFDSENYEEFCDLWIHWPKDELGECGVSFIDKETGEYRVHFGCDTCFYDKLLDVHFVQPFSTNKTIRVNVDDLVQAQLRNGEWAEATVESINEATGEVTLAWRESPPDDESLNKRNKDDIKLVLTKSFYGDVYNVGYPYENLEDFIRRNFEASAFRLEVIVRDSLVSPKVFETLNEYLDRLSASPNPDFHPGSEGKVLDLIHPSLYCYVKGKSKSRYGNVAPYDECEQPRNAIKQRTGFFSREYEPSRYQWLPSEFQVSEEGKVDILSYINGLASPEQLPGLYRAIGDLFECFLPHFHQCLKDLDHPASISGLKGRKLQVICKAVDYILKPGETHQGVWHVEGMAFEHIIATGIYYMSMSSHMKDEGLAFRRQITEDEEELLIEKYTHEHPPPFDYDNSAIGLGKVQTFQDRCIIFPNSYQHKVLGLQNISSNTARRRIFCFFLIDPTEQLISTIEIPDQRQLTLQTELAALLQKASLNTIGSLLPKVIMMDILSFSFSGMTLAEAKEHRIKLMHERKYQKDRLNREMERPVSLCEH